MDNETKDYLEKSSYTKVIVLYLAIMFVLSTIIATIFAKYTADMKDTPSLYEPLAMRFSTILNLSIYVILVIMAVVVLFEYLKKDAVDFIKLKWRIPIFLVAGYLILCCGNIVSNYINELMGIKGSSANQSSIEDMVDTFPILMIISAGLLGPIVEEIVFRKCIFGYFKKDLIPFFLSSFIFGLLHVLSALDFINIIPYLISGFIFGGIYHFSKRNLFVVIIIHSLSNLIAIMLLIIR